MWAPARITLRVAGSIRALTPWEPKAICAHAGAHLPFCQGCRLGQLAIVLPQCRVLSHQEFSRHTHQGLRGHVCVCHTRTGACASMRVRVHAYVVCVCMCMCAYIYVPKTMPSLREHANTRCPRARMQLSGLSPHTRLLWASHCTDGCSTILIYMEAMFTCVAWVAACSDMMQLLYFDLPGSRVQACWVSERFIALVLPYQTWGVLILVSFQDPQQTHKLGDVSYLKLPNQAIPVRAAQVAPLSFHSPFKSNKCKVCWSSTWAVENCQRDKFANCFSGDLLSTWVCYSKPCAC